MGGSVPLVMIEEIRHDHGAARESHNNQHSFNENIRLQDLWDGIEMMAALLM